MKNGGGGQLYGKFSLIDLAGKKNVNVFSSYDVKKLAR